MDLTLRNLIERFLEWGENFLAAGTCKNYRRLLERFALAAGELPAAGLRAHVLLAWGKTWHEIQAVQRLFNWAVHDAQLLAENPFKRVKRPPLGQRSRILDRGVMLRMFRKTSPAFRRYLIALRETLARPQEIRAAKWENLWWPDKPHGMAQALQLGRAAFILEDFKGRRRRADPRARRVIPISPRLGRLIFRISCTQQPGGVHIFVNDRGRPWTNNAVRMRFRWLRKTLPLPRDHRGENVVAYSIRHTTATWAAAAGVRDRILAEVMGHTSTRTTARYQHLELAHLQQALAAVWAPGVGKKQGGSIPALSLLRPL